MLLLEVGQRLCYCWREGRGYVIVEGSTDVTLLLKGVQRVCYCWR